MHKHLCNHDSCKPSVEEVECIEADAKDPNQGIVSESEEDDEDEVEACEMPRAASKSSDSAGLGASPGHSEAVGDIGQDV